MAVVTEAEARAACLARGAWDAAECEAQIEAQKVGGVYCDGAIVWDAGGRRCVPRDVVDRVKALSDAGPLPVRPPSPALAEESKGSGWWLVALGVVVVGIVWRVSR